MNRLSRRALLGAGAVAALAACSPHPEAPLVTARPQPTSSPVSLTFGLTFVPNVQFAPAYVAVDEGLFDNYAVNVKLRHHGQSESLFGALQAGTEDVVFAGGSEVMAARDEGFDVMSFATMYQRYPVALLVPDDSPINTAADLKGHSVGIPGPFGENYLALLAMLEDARLTTADVDIQHIGYTQSAALQAKRVDSVIGFTNNDAVQMRRAGLKIREIALPADVPLVAAGLIGNRSYVLEHTEVLTRFTWALQDAIKVCRQHPDVAIKATMNHVPGMAGREDQQAAREVLDATLPLYGELVGAQDLPRWQAMSQFLNARGITKTAIDPTLACTDEITKRI